MREFIRWAHALEQEFILFCWDGPTCNLQLLVISSSPLGAGKYDWPMWLPNSHRHNAILTIVNHSCTRAALFLPCTTNVTGEGIAKLYLDNIYRWFGIPSKIISDRDPRFTSHFSTSLCQHLGIDRNISTAYHPQTDGLSEQKNQWVEQYLRFVTSASQDDWSNWLTIATAVHNNYPNATTCIAPIEALLGYFPQITIELPYPPTTVQPINDRTQKATEKRKQAKEALNEAAWVTPPDSYQIGDKVWLEAKHLALPYQMPKLAPKCHGPFTIIKRVLPVVYQLKLPAAWTIHDVFHASLLTPYRETIEHGTNYTRPPPDFIKDAEEYKVEAIVNHRHFGRKRQLQYLIKWKGYPDADNTWESADHVHAPTLIQAYHRRNLLEPPEQDKKRRRKCKVSIHSLKSFLQQYHTLLTTCLPPLPKSSPMNSLPQPPLSLTLPPRHPLLLHLQKSSPPSSDPPTDHPSHWPPIPILNLARSLTRSSRRVTLSRLNHWSTSSRPVPTSTPTPLALLPSGWPTLPSATHSSTLRRKVRLPSSARSLWTFVLKCHVSPTQSAPRDSRRITADSRTSPSLMLTESCAKRTTLNWATAQSPSPSAPWDKRVTPSSNTTYLPPPPIFVTCPPSHSLCGSSTPSPESPLPITKPWIWLGARTTGVWSPSSPATMRPTHVSSTSPQRSMRSTASYRWPRLLVAKVAAVSRGPMPSTIFEPSRPLTRAVPPVPMHTPPGFVSAVVGHHS